MVRGGRFAGPVLAGGGAGAGEPAVAGPAEQAGLQSSSKSVTINGQDVMVGGDVITAIDHQNITGMQDLQTILRQDKVGQQVTLTILRDGKQQDVTVTLAARPSTIQ